MLENSQQEIQAIIVHQWLKMWDDVKFIPGKMRRKPAPHFYVFTMSADKLRRLSDIYRRRTDKPRAQDPAIQRKHIPERSDEIRKFIRGGFPWSDLSDRQQKSPDYKDLQMPGWLPTAIIANILAPDTKRGREVIENCDVIEIVHLNDQMAKLVLPLSVGNQNWNPKVSPMEIIDGQHRLLAFEGDRPPDGDYELPVVAFYNLDITWQAYLFYMINIKPKRIDPSLAFDLYPILRIQDWLEKTPETAKIYRETRAQELTEVLWSHPESPWRNRISMLGERKRGMVTQSAFIRSLMASYIKRGQTNAIGGLFGSQVLADSEEFLSWDRAQQAAFLILVWDVMAEAVEECGMEWANHLRKFPSQDGLPTIGGYISDQAFISNYSLLATDQGVRGILQVTNDMCYVSVNKLGLESWEGDENIEEGTVKSEVVSRALQSLQQLQIKDFLRDIANELVKFDWRTSSTPELEEDKRKNQMIFRGSGGYRELRRQLILLLKSADNERIRETASEVSLYLGF